MAEERVGHNMAKAIMVVMIAQSWFQLYSAIGMVLQGYLR